MEIHSERQKHPKRSQSPQPTCRISSQIHALSYSSPLLRKNFYQWVNHKWLRKTPMPTFENDFGVSEEVERCIFEKSYKILMNIKESDSKNPNHVFLRTLAESCLHSASQHHSVSYLKRILHSLDCLTTTEDFVKEFAHLSVIGYPSLFGFFYRVEDGKQVLCLDGNTSSLFSSYYKDDKKVAKYKQLLQKVGPMLDVDDLEHVYPMEHSFASTLEDKWSEEYHKTTGRAFAKKFSKFPWHIWFEAHNLKNWKTMTFYYRSPQWIRFVSQMLKEVSEEYWRLYLARAYIVPSLQYLPPPFDELDYSFFGRVAQGQLTKTPQKELLVQIVYNFCHGLFSKLYWDEEGDPKIIEPIHDIYKKIVKATCTRIENTKWMAPETRKKAIEKVKAIHPQLVRPKEWTPFTPISLESDNLLWNIFQLGANNTRMMLDSIGSSYKFWDDGIFRVNAYYYNENNEIMVPYGTLYSPFYDKKKSLAWNLGAIGSVIGHEICHAFDEDGRLYDAKGKKTKWWTRRDNVHFNHQKKQLISFYNKQTVDKKHVNGKKTLSENIADLGGLAIALDALLLEDSSVESIRTFFISYAVSWRTKYRKQKLQRMIELDSHAPAFVRVNAVVCQFDEWYEAFDIQDDHPMYVPPKDRIRIF